MTIQQALNKASQSEIELLLGAVLKQSKEFLYLHPQQNLTLAQEKKFNQLLKGFKAEIPIAYLLGYKDFFRLRFKVSRATLIPRPESEWLVERALEILKGKSRVQVLDIGTGSGCLAISIKRHSPQALITATDINSQALEVAKQNALTHKVKIKLKKQNLLQGDSTKYDLIIANLPYVPKKDFQKFYENLKYEPKYALIDKAADFDLYQRLLQKVSTNLKPHGTLLLEIDPTMKPQLQTWQKQHWPGASFKFTKDLHGLWRFCEISMPVKN